MKAAVAAFIGVAIVASAASALDDEQSAAPTLVVVAHQDFGSSFVNAWTVRLAGDEVSVEREGKPAEVRRLGRHELDGVTRVITAARLDTIQARLGAPSICDDCPRCRVTVEVGGKSHRVEWVAQEAGSPQEHVVEDEQRFRVVWRAMKALGRVGTVPDACW